VDRAIHFLILSALAAAVFLFASDRAALDAEFTRILNDLQGGAGGPMTTSSHGIVHDLQYLFAVNIRNLYLVGAAIAAYALLEGIEAVGLWFARRWAEYLTFVATIVFLPYEVDELIKSVTWLKVLALIINLAVAVYLLYAKRLFGLRGGGRAEKAEREADTGWTAIERATPRSTPQPLLPDAVTERAFSTAGCRAREHPARRRAGWRPPSGRPGTAARTAGWPARRDRPG
jgi:uncharacterized membrane protein (DUF2068 family)